VPRWKAPPCRRKRGDATDPNPTDRGKPGTKRHLVVDARGTPLDILRAFHLLAAALVCLRFVERWFC
jgi:hypothetical protein